MSRYAIVCGNWCNEVWENTIKESWAKINGKFKSSCYFIFFENINPLLSTISSPSQKDGFVEVMCQGNKIRSLQDLSRGSFKKYAQQQSEKVKNDIADLLNNQNIIVLNVFAKKG